MGGFGRSWCDTACVATMPARRLGWRAIRDGREAVLTLSALTTDGAYRNGLSPKVRVLRPTGESSVTVLRQVAPGLYQARVPLATARSAPFRFELIESPGLSKQEVAGIGTRSLFYPYSDEYRMVPANIELLKALSRETGGKFAPRAEEIFADLGDGGTVSTELWQYFAATALLLFLLDIFVRRTPWTLPKQQQ